MKRVPVQTPAMAKQFLLGVVAMTALAWPGCVVAQVVKATVLSIGDGDTIRVRQAGKALTVRRSDSRTKADGKLDGPPADLQQGAAAQLADRHRPKARSDRATAVMKASFCCTHWQRPAGGSAAAADDPLDVIDQLHSPLLPVPAVQLHRLWLSVVTELDGKDGERF